MLALFCPTSILNTLVSPVRRTYNLMYVVVLKYASSRRSWGCSAACEFEK